MESQEEYSRVDALLKQSAWPPSKPSGTMKHICLHLTHFILIFDIHFNKKLLALKLSEGVFHSRGTFQRNFVDFCSLLFFGFLIFKEKNQSQIFELFFSACVGYFWSTLPCLQLIKLVPIVFNNHTEERHEKT